MSTQLSFLEKVVEDLIKSKHNNYSEECLNFYIDDELFSIQDVQKIENRRGERLKCSLIRHKIQSKSAYEPQPNSKCIVYLHGFGSSRLEALSLVGLLPTEYSLCIFDMSGSGKSDGQKITYGVKEQQDIEPIMNFLYRKRFIKEFVIWGRSMGAVAALLYTINHHRYGKLLVETKVRSASQSLKSSVMFSKNLQSNDQPTLLGLVLDSPFFKFSQIAKQIAQKKLLVPSFLLDMALGYVEQSFKKILANSIGQQYNPFLINFDQRIRLAVPSIFVYSQNDEVIASSHSERIMKNMDSRFKKVIISPCTHNQTRPEESIREIFNILENFGKIIIKKGIKPESANSKELSIQSANRSLQKKRGIFVYTPSKQLKKQQSIASAKYHQPVSIEMVKTEQVGLRSPKYRSHSRKNIVTLELRKQKKEKASDKLLSTQNQLSNPIGSIDLEMTKLLNRKLLDPQQNRGLKMTRTNRRYGYDKRKDFKLSNEKYLH